MTATVSRGLAAGRLFHPPRCQRVVVALGGNALLRRDERPDVATQARRAREAARSLAALSRGCELVITHGNGPQVGLLALQAAAFPEFDVPLDVLGAESEGMIGHLLTLALRNALQNRSVATLFTQVVVDAADPAFATPTKPIGPWYEETTASQLERERGWTFVRDRGRGRRVVASPEPHEILELRAIELLVRDGTLVVCGGGGGVPVTRAGDGTFAGAAAVVDKDLLAALLASSLSADALVLLTDVDAVYRDWGTAWAEPIHRVTAQELRALDFAAGTMAPKVEAACRFVELTRGRAAIGALDDARSVVRGMTGTVVTP